MTGEAPTFFILPNAPDAVQEELYRTMAQVCGRTPPAPESRVFSIDYIHDGIEWTATVGRQLLGVKTTYHRGNARRTPHSDPVTVLAIFPGNPYKVVTNAAPFGEVRSEWVNPFMAGIPTRVTLFRSPGVSA